MEEIDKLKPQLKILLSQNKIGELFKRIRDVYNADNKLVELDSLLILESRYNQLQKDNQKGIIEVKDYNTEANKIKDSLLIKINNLDKKTHFHSLLGTNIILKIVLFFVISIGLYHLPMIILIMLSSAGMIEGDYNFIFNLIIFYFGAFILWYILLRKMFWK